MRRIGWTASGWTLALALVSTVPAAAQGNDAPKAVALQATGTFARGGDFSGTVTINRFEQRGTQIVAIGVVQGVLRRGGRALGTGVAAEVAWPVTASAGGVVLANRRSSSVVQLSRVRWSADGFTGSRMVPVQAEGCSVLQIALGPLDVDLLGIQVSLAPVALSLTGAPGTALGDLVCAVIDLLGNVAAVVELLNSILGLLTGLLGGIVGGIGGVVPGGA